MKRLLSFVIFCGILLLIIGCSKGEQPVVSDDPQVEPEEEQEVDEQLPYVHPLTGEGTEELNDIRPIAVSINNHPKARPQSGLIDADVVYEVLAEGEITRFVALFQSKQPDNVGPVRSARGYFIDLLNGYDAMFVTHGWSPEAQVMLEKQGKADYLSGLTYDGTYFKRSKERRAPHNSYITYAAMLEGLEKRGYTVNRAVDPLVFVSDEEAVPTGLTAQEVSIDYLGRYKVEYRYNPATKSYARYSDGAQTVDHETGAPIEADNLFIVEMEHRIVDNEGRREINLTSGGKGLLIQRGVMQEVNWENQKGRILPVIDGEVVGLYPGQTWINIIPSQPGLEQSVHTNDL